MRSVFSLPRMRSLALRFFVSTVLVLLLAWLHAHEGPQWIGVCLGIVNLVVGLTMILEIVSLWPTQLRLVKLRSQIEDRTARARSASRVGNLWLTEVHSRARDRLIAEFDAQFRWLAGHK